MTKGQSGKSFCVITVPPEVDKASLDASLQLDLEILNIVHFSYFCIDKDKCCCLNLQKETDA